ncbi:MAG: glycoside hydrolase family 19 protein [Aquabacterium sp.]|uniref:glycoside hydrolase family 19 protein n=1 Tax=Aquabacterium sp. TaxID=1872578 RepID=UPI0027236508|nr:glycoside hydrolase family 19 protein [Aquabacterium sp.]MDO9006089.1 glycoside hydrolase family 19 protein [Aquabacterium sp.]
MAALLACAIPGTSFCAPFKADRAWFFDKCAVLQNYEINDEGTAAVTKGKTLLSEPMKAGLNHLLDSWEKFGDADANRLAFVLGTVRRESMGTFEPVREAPRCGSDEGCRERAIGKLLADRAAKSGKSARANYALPDVNGQRFYGRGFVQITLRENYQKTGAKLGLDLVSAPDKVLDPDIAGQILIRGMLEGWYGSKKPLSAYIDGDKVDRINARNNVNPHSPNKPITAAYAKEFGACLRPLAGSP